MYYLWNDGSGKIEIIQSGLTQEDVFALFKFFPIGNLIGYVKDPSALVLLNDAFVTGLQNWIIKNFKKDNPAHKKAIKWAVVSGVINLDHLSNTAPESSNSTI